MGTKHCDKNRLSDRSSLQIMSMKSFGAKTSSFRLSWDQVAVWTEMFRKYLFYQSIILKDNSTLNQCGEPDTVDQCRAADHGESSPPPVSHRGCVGECAREGHPAVRTDPPIHRKRPGVAQPLLLDGPACRPMTARQSVTHPLPFPMEARRRGGLQEAHLVEWPLKQQSAVNMLWCHAPNRHRADCPRRRERTLAPGRRLAKRCRCTAPRIGCARTVNCGSEQESLSGDLSGDGQLLDIDSAQRLEINWPCGNTRLNHGPGSCAVRLPE